MKKRNSRKRLNFILFAFLFLILVYLIFNIILTGRSTLAFDSASSYNYPLNLNFILYDKDNSVVDNQGPILIEDSSGFPVEYNSPDDLDEGIYTLNVTINDSLGNYNEEYVGEIVIDQASLDLFVFSPLEGNYGNAVQLLNISSNGDNVWYNWNGTNITYTIPINITFAEGLNALIIYANDSAGNLNSTSVSFTIDITAPVFTNLANKSLSINSSFAYDIDATDNSTIDCFNVNDTAKFNINCSGYMINATNLNLGTYLLNISVNDSFGHIRYGVIYVNVTNPDTQAPAITISSPLSGNNYNTTSIKLNVSANESITLWKYSLNSGSNMTFTPNKTISALTGSNKLDVWAKDDSGNWGHSSLNFFVTLANSLSSERGNQENPSLVCSPVWECTSWTTCENGKHSRICSDKMNCGFSIGKPSEFENCLNLNGSSLNHNPDLSSPFSKGISISKTSNEQVTIKNDLSRTLDNVTVVFEIPKPLVSPQEIYPRPKIGWGWISQLILGISIKGEVDYENVTTLRMREINYEKIESGELINLNFSLPFFEKDTKSFIVKFFENNSLIQTYTFSVNPESKEFFSIVSPGKSKNTKEVYIYYENKANKPRDLTIEFVLKENGEEVFLSRDYLGPYHLESNESLFVAQEYKFSNKILRKENSSIQLNLLENDQFLDSYEVTLNEK